MGQLLRLMTAGAGAWLAACFGLYLMYAFFTGTLYFYIHPIYVVPTVASGVVLLALAFLGGRGGTDHHGGASPVAVGLLALALALGWALPARPLGLATATQRGVDATPLGRAEEIPEFRVDTLPEAYTIKDWVKLQQADPEPERQAGKPVRVTGFVYRDATLPPGWFLVARFVVRCCAVDAQPIGLPVRAPAGEVPGAGAWVQVAGAWAVAEVGGQRKAVIEPSAVTLVNSPDQPYLY